MLNALQHNPQTTNHTLSETLRVTQVSVLPDLLNVTAPTEKILNCSVQDRYMHETTSPKNHEEILTAE